MNSRKVEPENLQGTLWDEQLEAISKALDLQSAQQAQVNKKKRSE